MVRTGFALLFTYVVAIAIPQHPTLPGHFVTLIVAGIKEITLGLFMGLTVRLAFQAAALAGEVIDSQAGFARDSYFDPILQGSGGPTNRLLAQFAIVAFLTTGMHLLVFSSFVKSFDIVQLGQWIPSQASVMLLVQKSSEIINLGIQIAAPFIAFNFIINMSFAVLGKAAPQMNVFVVSFAVLILGGLLLLIFSLDVIAQRIIEILKESASNLLLMIQAR